MIKQLRGTSELALMVEHLPVRGRIGLVVMAAELALPRLKPLPNFPVAKEAFELARRSFDGEPVDPDSFEDAIYSEHGEGVGVCAIHAKSQPEISAWLVLESALLYIAFHTYRALGQVPTPLVSEVDEPVLDELDKDLRVISPGELHNSGEDR